MAKTLILMNPLTVRPSALKAALTALFFHSSLVAENLAPRQQLANGKPAAGQSVALDPSAGDLQRKVFVIEGDKTTYLE